MLAQETGRLQDIRPRYPEEEVRGTARETDVQRNMEKGCVVLGKQLGL